MKLPRLRADYGSILLGSADDSSRLTRVRVQLVITIGVIVANLIGVFYCAKRSMSGCVAKVRRVFRLPRSGCECSGAG